jgi:hypothetical protein
MSTDITVRSKNKGWRRRSDMKHIESHRLFELAEMSAITDQREWKHIKDCPECGLAFIHLKAVIEGCPGYPVTSVGSIPKAA